MFNKIFLSGLLAVTLSQASDEFSSERLLGIEVGYASLNSNSNKVNQKVNGIEYGLRIGAQNEEWRTTLVGNFYTEGSHKYQRVMLEFDRFVWSSLYETDNIIFKPYLGGHVGWMKYTDDFSLSDNSMVYGGQAGLAWNVLNEVDFDLGYRYSVVDMPNVDDIGALTLGVNYIY